MSFFKSKPKPAPYVAPTGAVTLTRAQFATTMRVRPAFRAYAQAVGLARATQALDDAFTENLRGTAASGFWAYGTSGNVGNPTQLRFQGDAELGVFFGAIDMLFGFDKTKIDGRATYLTGLLGKADAGLLRVDLQANAETEANYYVAPVPVPQRPGTPVVPPKPAGLVNRAKALAWLTWGVQGSTAAFSQALTANATDDGSFPLGPNHTQLLAAWQSMVPIAPAYRGWNNAASQQKYPSNLGGLQVLDAAFAELSTRPMPPRGDNAWYDLALYVYGAVVTAQAFTDGNKRAGRLAYASMLLSGGVPMVAPNGRLGSRLGDML